MELFNALFAKGVDAKNALKAMLTKEDGEANIVAIILVIAIVVALAIVFREAIGDLFESIWAGIIGDTNSATQNY